MDSIGARTKRRRMEKQASHDGPHLRFSGTTLDGTDSPEPSSSATASSRPVVSFRERLFPQTKTTPSGAPHGTTAQKNPRSTVSIAPIFKRKIVSGFQHEPGLSDLSPQAREKSPEAGPEDLIKRLKRHYLDTAETLHERAIIQLQQTHSDLTRRFREALEGEDAFVASIEKQNKTLCAPLSQSVIRSEQRDPADGSIHTVKSSVGELVKSAQARLGECQADLARLWLEWNAAEEEIQRTEKAYNEMVPGEMAEGTNFAEMMAKYGDIIRMEIEEAEEEVGELSEAALAEMKEIEKDFRKATLPDLHVFFQSIDEP